MPDGPPPQRQQHAASWEFAAMSAHAGLRPKLLIDPNLGDLGTGWGSTRLGRPHAQQTWAELQLE